MPEYQMLTLHRITETWKKWDILKKDIENEVYERQH